MGYIDLEAGIDAKARAVQEKTRDFGMSVMRPIGIELDKMHDPADTIAKTSPLWEMFRKHRESGLHKMMIPKAYGGTMEKTPPYAMSLMSQELGYADSGLAISLGVAGMPFAFSVLSPSAEVRDWARQFVEDKEANLVGCWAITEPDHGSDWVIGVSTGGSDPKIAPNLRAVKKGDEYILNGWKSAWVSNGTIATHAVLHVGLDQSMGMHGSGIAMCPLDLPGISKGKPLDKIGQRALNQGEIIFEDVKLHKKYMLVGVPGIFGSNIFGRTFLGVVNSMMGLTFTGLARAVLDESIKFARENPRGGTPLFEQQMIKLKLFNMFARIESSRLFSMKVAEHPRSKSPGFIIRALSSLFMSSKLTYRVVGSVIQRLLRLYERDKEHKLIKRLAKGGNENPINQWGKYGVASKVLATETAFSVASEAMQIFGPRAISTDCIIEKLFRDARASMIEDGANEVLALAASESL